MTRKTRARPSPSAKKAAPVNKAAPEPRVADEPAAVTAQNADEPAVHRAGGWIDRGDGRGWELEE